MLNLRLHQRSFARFPPSGLAMLLGYGVAGGPCAQRSWAQSDAPETRNPDTEGVEIEVVGSRPHPASSGTAPHVASSTLRRSRLDQAGVEAGDVLREAPGVQVSESGGLGAPTTANIRGATASQTPVFLGSVRINDEVGGVANLDEVPVFLVDRIEVFRSHAPPVLSAPSIGGAILFVPRRPKKDETLVNVFGGSWGLRGAEGAVALTSSQRAVLSGFSVKAADNDYPFNNSKGTLFTGEDDTVAKLENADSEQKSFWMFARERQAAAELELFVMHTDREQGAPKLALTPSESARAAFSRDLFALTSRVPVPAWRGDIHAVTSATAAQTILNDPEQELGLLSSRVQTSGKRIEQVVDASQRIGELWTLRQQISVSNEQLRRESVNQELVAQRFSTRMALSGEISFPSKASLSALGALRCFDTGQSDLTACDEKAPDAQATLAYSPGDFSVSATGGHYYRIPTLSELFGSSLLVRGNPKLTVERGRSAEAVVRYQRSRSGLDPSFWVELSPFARVSESLIVYVRSAQGYLLPRNLGSARTLGLEFSSGGRPLSGVLLEGHLSLLDPRDTSPDRVVNNDVLPFRSRAVGFARAEVEIPLRALSERYPRIGSQVSYQSSRYADPAGLGVIPAQSSWDATLEVPISIGPGHVDLKEGGALVLWRTRAANLLGAERFDVIGYPLPGRSLFTSLEITW